MANANVAITNEVPVDRNPEVSFTLPGRLYHAPEVLEEEKAKIFGRFWQYACPASDVARPGDYVAVDAAGEAIFVVRGRDGILRAFYNVCQHRAHRLVEGRGSLKAVVTCPYHAWAYGLDGALRAARNCEAVKGFDKKEFGLRPVRIEEQLGLIFFNLDDEAPSLEEVAGDMFADIRASVPFLDELVAFREDRDDIGFSFDSMAFNWKVLIDNCLECYHCEPAHPAFCDLIDMGSYRTVTHQWWSSAKSRLLKHENAAYDVAPDAASQSGDFWFLFPNMTFGVLPGNASFLTFVVDPTGPETTITRSDYFGRPGEEANPARADYGRDVLWAEDKAICESVHRGLKSKGYGQGRFIVDAGRSHISEHGVHHFHVRYAEAMGLI